MPLLDRALPGRRLIEDVAALSFALESWIGLLILLVIGQCMLTLATLRYGNNLFAAAYHLAGITW